MRARRSSFYDPSAAAAGCRNITSVLRNLEFFIETEAADLFFEWLPFIETCQRVWDEIYTAIDALEDEDGTYGPESKSDDGCRLPYATAMEILEEGSSIQQLAENWERLESVDEVRAYVRDHATGAGVAWRTVQRIIREGIKVPLDLKDRDELLYDPNSGDLSSWVGDQHVFRVLSRDLGSTIYPHLLPPLMDKIYANWPSADLDRAAVRRMNLEIKFRQCN